MIPTYFGVYNICYAGKHSLKDYKDRGYITGQATTQCSRELYELDYGAIEHMEWAAYDHEMQSFYCEGNFSPYDGTFAILVGISSIVERCMYNKLTTTYALEYGSQFFHKYRDEAKFFRLGFLEAHEGTLEAIKYSDDIFTNFFEEFERQGHLDDTIIIFLSDYGLSVVSPYTRWDSKITAKSWFCLLYSW